MKTLTATKPYSGRDEEADRDISVAVGETVEVSDEKAAQLERDFPNSFEEFGGTPVETSTPESKEGDIVKDLDDRGLVVLWINVSREIVEREIDDEAVEELIDDDLVEELRGLFGSEAPEGAGGGEDGESSEAPKEDLSELSREVLNEKAAELGIEKPDKIKGGKPKVIEAIEAKLAESAESKD